MLLRQIADYTLAVDRIGSPSSSMSLGPATRQSALATCRRWPDRARQVASPGQASSPSFRTTSQGRWPHPGRAQNVKANTLGAKCRFEPIEPPWQAIREWIPDDDAEPSFDLFDQRPASGKPVEIPREDGNILVLDGD